MFDAGMFLLYFGSKLNSFDILPLLLHSLQC